MFGGSPKFWLTGGDELNKRQQSRDAVGFNKNASRFAWGGFVQCWRGQKITIFVSAKKAVDVRQAVVRELSVSHLLLKPQ